MSDMRNAKYGRCPVSLPSPQSIPPSPHSFKSSPTNDKSDHSQNALITAGIKNHVMSPRMERGDYFLVKFFKCLRQ